MSVFTEETAALGDWRLSRALNWKCSLRGRHCSDPGVLIVSNQLYIQRVSALLLFQWRNERVRSSATLFKLNGILESTVIELHADNLAVCSCPRPLRLVRHSANERQIKDQIEDFSLSHGHLTFVHTPFRIIVDHCKVYLWWKGFVILGHDLTHESGGFSQRREWKLWPQTW